MRKYEYVKKLSLEPCTAFTESVKRLRKQISKSRTQAKNRKNYKRYENKPLM